MSNLHVYQDKAAYDAATDRPAGQPNTSKVAEDVIIEGVNVAVPIKRGLLGVGDHIVYDRVDGMIKAIKRDTFKKSYLNLERYVDGKSVYVCDIDDKPFVVGIEETSKAFSQYSHCKITGFDLENGGTAKINYSTSFVCEFSYSAGATWAEIAAAMNAARTGSYASYVSFQALDDCIGCLTWPNLTVASGGLTIRQLNAVKADDTEVPGNVAWHTLADFCDLTEIGVSAMLMDGVVASYPAMHKAEFITYETMNGSTTFGDEKSRFMNQATFNACNNSGVPEQQALYDKYNGNYAAYADVCASMRLINYDVPNNTAETLRTGKHATEELAGVKIYDFDEVTLLDAFPAAAWAHAYGITTDGITTGFEAGNWHELGVGELSRIMRIATSRTSTLDAGDLLNNAIKDDNGTVIIGNTSYALCGASVVDSQLYYTGTYGLLDVSFRINSSRVRVALDLNYQ